MAILISIRICLTWIIKLRTLTLAILNKHTRSIIIIVIAKGINLLLLGRHKFNVTITVLINKMISKLFILICLNILSPQKLTFLQINRRCNRIFHCILKLIIPGIHHLIITLVISIRIIRIRII